MNHTPVTERPDTACRTADPELFFTDRPEDVREAKRVCGRCPHVADCLREALERREPWGVWGGAYLQGGAITMPPDRARAGAGLPVDAPAGVDTVLVQDFAAMLDRTPKYVMTMLRNGRRARAEDTADGGELPEPIAGGTSGRPFRWRRDVAEAYASVTPRQRRVRHPVAA